MAALLIVCPAHYCTAPYDRPHSRAKDQQVQNSFATKWQCNNCVMWQECDIFSRGKTRRWFPWQGLVFPLLSLSDVCRQCREEQLRSTFQSVFKSIWDLRIPPAQLHHRGGWGSAESGGGYGRECCLAIVVVVGGDKCVILFAILSGWHQQHIKSTDHSGKRQAW